MELEQLPSELQMEIATHLDPPSALALSMASQYFRRRLFSPSKYDNFEVIHLCGRHGYVDLLRFALESGSLVDEDVVLESVKADHLGVLELLFQGRTDPKGDVSNSNPSKPGLFPLEYLHFDRGELVRVAKEHRSTRCLHFLRDLHASAIEAKRSSNEVSSSSSNHIDSPLEKVQRNSEDERDDVENSAGDWNGALSLLMSAEIPVSRESRNHNLLLEGLKCANMQNIRISLERGATLSMMELAEAPAAFSSPTFLQFLFEVADENNPNFNADIKENIDFDVGESIQDIAKLMLSHQPRLETIKFYESRGYSFSQEDYDRLFSRGATFWSDIGDFKVEPIDSERMECIDYLHVKYGLCIFSSLPGVLHEVPAWATRAQLEAICQKYVYQSAEAIKSNETLTSLMINGYLEGRLEADLSCFAFLLDFLDAPINGRNLVFISFMRNNLEIMDMLVRKKGIDVLRKEIERDYFSVNFIADYFSKMVALQFKRANTVLLGEYSSSLSRTLLPPKQKPRFHNMIEFLKVFKSIGLRFAPNYLHLFNVGHRYFDRELNLLFPVESIEASSRVLLLTH